MATKASALKAATKQGHMMSAFDDAGSTWKVGGGRTGLFQSSCLHRGCQASIGIRGDGHVYNGSAFAPCTGTK